MLRHVLVAAAASALAFSFSCGGGGSNPDGGADVSAPDSAPDAIVADSGDAGGATYNDMTHASFWSQFDTTTVTANAKGFEGGVFDGRYVYFVPYTAGKGIITRYDTQATFGTVAAWETFDTQTVDTNANGFAGAAFDGRYIYLAPRHGLGNVVAQYDTQASFTTKASWSTFTTTVLDANASGFVGAVFDGHYVYFVPYNNAANVYHGHIVRYDTQAAFGTQGSWSTFDTTTVDPNAKGFYGGVFDGHYLYLVPWISGTLDGGADAYGSIVARYDTTQSFTTQGSWSTFDTTTVASSAKGFSGGAFDGKFVYLVPAINGTVVRYDSTQSFTTGGSWSTFDATTVKSTAYGFTGATFDGRWVYFSPYYNTTYDGVVTRYDTQAAFGTAGSWQTFDTATLNPSSVGFIGNVFDGRYMYLVPCTNGSYDGIVTRFDSKSPPSMPALPKFAGSFL